MGRRGRRRNCVRCCSDVDDCPAFFAFDHVRELVDSVCEKYTDIRAVRFFANFSEFWSTIFPTPNGITISADDRDSGHNSGNLSLLDDPKLWPLFEVHQDYTEL